MRISPLLCKRAHLAILRTKFFVACRTHLNYIFAICYLLWDSFLFILRSFRTLFHGAWNKRKNPVELPAKVVGRLKSSIFLLLIFRLLLQNFFSVLYISEMSVSCWEQWYAEKAIKRSVTLFLRGFLAENFANSWRLWEMTFAFQKWTIFDALIATL